MSILSTIARTEDGYLQDHLAWNESIAIALASEEGIVLTEPHWEIIYYLRNFYRQFHLIPQQRIMIKAIAKDLGGVKGNSIYLLKLFPGGVLKQSCKIA